MRALDAQTRADLDALRERDGEEREVVAEWTRPDPIARLRELLAAGTTAPFTVRRYQHGGGRVSDASDRFLVADLYSEPNRELWIAAVQHLPWLLDEIDRLRKANEALASLAPALEPTGDHHQLPDGYCLDCGGGCLRGLAEENAEAIRQASFAGPSPFHTRESGRG